MTEAGREPWAPLRSGARLPVTGESSVPGVRMGPRAGLRALGVTGNTGQGHERQEPVPAAGAVCFGDRR